MSKIQEGDTIWFDGWEYKNTPAKVIRVFKNGGALIRLDKNIMVSPLAEEMRVKK